MRVVVGFLLFFFFFFSCSLFYFEKKEAFFFFTFVDACCFWDGIIFRRFWPNCCVNIFGACIIETGFFLLSFGAKLFQPPFKMIFTNINSLQLSFEILWLRETKIISQFDMDVANGGKMLNICVLFLCV